LLVLALPGFVEVDEGNLKEKEKEQIMSDIIVRDPTL
jgi:hypothetical protein